MGLNIFTRAALIAVLVNNDFHYLHYNSAGQDFDKSHNLAEDYSWRMANEIDWLMELALEFHSPVYNFTIAHQYIPEYQYESESQYDYPTLVERLSNKIALYVNTLKELRSNVNDSSVQSVLDEMIRYWMKELNYKLDRRAEKPISEFINTGFDTMMARMYEKQANRDYLSDEY